MHSSIQGILKLQQFILMMVQSYDSLGKVTYAVLTLMTVTPSHDHNWVLGIWLTFTTSCSVLLSRDHDSQLPLGNLDCLMITEKIITKSGPNLTYDHSDL